MPVNIIRGNIFTTQCQTIVNAINCVGVMGRGIALEYRLRYPEMYLKYIGLCDAKAIDIGMLWLYKSNKKWILNFPTKKHWRYPSKKEYLHSGLEKFVATYKSKEIESIAFPMLGADRGGINQAESLEITSSYLNTLDIQVEIYIYDRNAKDDLYQKTKEWLLSRSVESVSNKTGISANLIRNVYSAMHVDDIVQLNQLANVKGIGIKTLERLFRITQDESNHEQGELFGNDI